MYYIIYKVTAFIPWIELQIINEDHIQLEFNYEMALPVEVLHKRWMEE